MFTLKEIAEFKREKADLEKKRADLKAKAANHRSMSADEMDAAADELEKTNKRMKELEDSLNEAPESPNKRGRNAMLYGVELTQENYRSSKEYRDAFYRSYLNNKVSDADADIMSHGKRSITDMNGGSVQSGAEYLVPLTTLNRVFSVMKKYGKLYASVTRFKFTGDVSLPIGTAGSPTDNSDGTTSLNFTFTDVKLSQEAIVAAVEVKNLLLRNSIEAFEDYIGMEIGKYVGTQCEHKVLNAPADGETFRGIIPSIKAAPSAAKTYSTFDFAKLCEIIAALESPYGDDATWVMKRSTFFKKVFSLTDNTGKPIVTVAPLVQGAPGQDNYGTASPFLIVGQPVIFSSEMPDTDGMLYGDLSTFIVNESEALVIESDKSEKFSADKTVWRGKVYSSGKPLFAKTAFAYYSYSAT